MNEEQTYVKAEGGRIHRCIYIQMRVYVYIPWSLAPVAAYCHPNITSAAHPVKSPSHIRSRWGTAAPVDIRSHGASWTGSKPKNVGDAPETTIHQREGTTTDHLDKRPGWAPKCCPHRLTLSRCQASRHSLSQNGAFPSRGKYRYSPLG